MTAYIPSQMRELVLDRANYRCEYCLLHRDDEPVYLHEIDHVIVQRRIYLIELGRYP